MTLYPLLADVVLTLHTAVVVFVVGGLLAIWLGNLRGCCVVNALWFRLAHLATITFVAAEAWLGMTCPITTLEQWLRSKANLDRYEGSFIEHWLAELLFWQAPPWVFTTAYTVFALAVVVTWWYFPPERCGRRRGARSAR